MIQLEHAIRNNDYNDVMNQLTVDPNCIDQITSNGTFMSCLAASTGNEEIVRYIVEYSRASFNEADYKHRTALHYAVESGNLSLVTYLTERVGLSPVEGDNGLITPFDLAVAHGYDHIKAYFEEYLHCTYENMYRNPIQTGMHPDPSIVRVGEDYYMVNSSFIYFPCIPISHSKDLIHWEVIGHAITDPNYAYLDELEGGRGYWAPDISYYKGCFYITATYRLNDGGSILRKQMVVSSSTPEGPYCKPSFIDEDGIDPSIFTDDDGKRYMLLNRGARIFKLNESATKQTSKAQLLYYGSNKRAPEGPHLLKKDGYYYLFLAEGGTGPGHRITCARATSLFGTYEPCPYNPIMRQWDEHAPIMRCGHGKPVQTQNGEWYMVYLCARMIDGKYSILGRETALDPITWTPDGWPIVNGLKGPSTLQKKPNLPEWNLGNKNASALWMYSNEWVSPRPPEAEGIIKSKTGITLSGSRASVSTMYARNLLLRRQTHFNLTFRCTMKLPVLKNGQHAGVTCYYDENTYLLFGLYAEKDILSVKVMEHIDTQDIFSLGSHQISIDAREITFIVTTKGLCRSFSYVLDNKEEIILGTLPNVYYLCDEGIKKGKRFTGAMYGMYAFSGEIEPRCKVTFTDFSHM